MKLENNIIVNYGILASMSWNSNLWAKKPTQEDLESSKYDYVRDYGHMHESLNFGHNIYPREHDGYYIGYTPMFNRAYPDKKKSKKVNIIFLISSDYKNSNGKTIVGFYGFPTFGERFMRTEKHKLYKTYDYGNFKAFPKNIIFFDKPILINNDYVKSENLLPKGKKISQQGFNYLNSDNVYNLIVLALKHNPQNKKLKSFVDKYPLLIEVTKETNDLKDFCQIVGDSNSDIIGGVAELEDKMKNQLPEIRNKISSYIERGGIATKIKKMTGYKCLICEAMKLNPFSFIKTNGNYYSEVHHVEQISTMKRGVLSVSNLITVCANHHRQLHYGNSKIIEQTNKYFKFEIDNKVIKIEKINILK